MIRNRKPETEYRKLRSVVVFGCVAVKNPLKLVCDMSREAFKARPKAFALRVIKMEDALPRDTVSRTLGQQLLRAGTSVAANYRAAVRGKSSADFIAKMGIVEEECDEALFWMELLVDCGRVKASRLADLLREGNEVLAVTVASIRTARRAR